jgi:hypothetical protein
MFGPVSAANTNTKDSADFNLKNRESDVAPTAAHGRTLNINNDLNTGGGSVLLVAGALSGGGTVSGDLTNDGGTLSPGNVPVCWKSREISFRLPTVACC